MKPIRDIAERIAEIQEKARKQQARSPQEAKLLPSNVVQLPLWPEAVRAVPNGVLRSALFGAIGKGKRRYINGEELAAVDGVTIRYKGESLDQGDLDVWESVLHAARLQELGNQCRITSYALLKLMGKTDSGDNRKTLHNRIERLTANAVTIRQGKYTYMGGLIAGAVKDEETQEWVIELDKKLSPLFAKDQFSQIDWVIRQELSGKPLAQWLHGYYASHAKPYPMGIDTLLKLSGSENEESRSSHQKMRKALGALTEACNKHGYPFRYEEKEGLIHVEKTGSKAQQKHLVKKQRG